jgi:hypothetical protein
MLDAVGSISWNLGSMRVITGGSAIGSNRVDSFESGSPLKVESLLQMFRYL